MNRKVTLLLIAAVAAILPAVAVADVMITGQISLVGTENTPVWELQKGSNFVKAYNVGAVNFSIDQRTYIPTIDLQGIANQTTTMINVIDLNITKDVAGTLWLNLTSSNLPVGTMMYISDTELSFGSLPAGQLIDSTVSTPSNLATLNVNFGDVYYIGFYLPANTGWGSSPSATISIEFMTMPTPV